VKRRYYRGTDVARALDIEELRHMAMRRLPGFVAEYVEGGSEDEETLHRNADAFAQYAFVHQVAVDVSQRTTASTLLGKPVGMPVVISPTGFNGLLWRNGDIAIAKAARALDIPFTASIVASDSIEAIAKEAGGRLWMMLLVLRDAAVVERLIERADHAGCEALVITLDAPVLGNRAWDARNFARPLVLSMRAKLDVLRHLRWTFGVLLRGLPGFGNLAEFLPPDKNSPLDGSRYMTANSNSALTWETLRGLRDRWKRKLVLKGVMSPDDAQQAARIGVDAVVISNHGGRQLDGELAPLDMLPEIVAAVGSRLEVIVDGGFRRGTDIAKALALGARGIGIGRSAIYGLAAGGEPGALRALQILRTELDRTMALLGCPTVDSLGVHVVRRVRDAPECVADHATGDPVDTRLLREIRSR
jgi:(S)-mandelate dehydrogenase